MGAGPTKINYEERDFTKEPLQGKEIDILLNALPEENIINSINNEGREQIVSSMSDQKLFNLKGDGIFDYYFTNNREAIKGCMEDRIKQNDESKFMATLEGSPTMELTVQDCREYANSIGAPFQPDYNNNTNPKGCFSQVNSAGINKVYYNNTSNEDTDCGAYGVSYCIEKNPTPTPCSDDNFNKMIDTIPGVINEPIQEILQNKNNDYNIEKSALQRKYNAEKSALQQKYNTEKSALQQKRQQKLDKLALDGFLVEPDMYNKMLMEKMSKKFLDIFTKNGDIDFGMSVKDFVEHESIKSTLNRSFEAKKTITEYQVNYRKGNAAKFLNHMIENPSTYSEQLKQTKLYFLPFILIMKIVSQYASSDNTKIIPNATLYNYFSDIFNEIGIDKTNIEYTLKFMTFNTFKKFMDYDLNNDVKGFDLYIRDFLKLIQEFGGKEYLNSLSNFEIDIGLHQKWKKLVEERGRK